MFRILIFFFFCWSLSSRLQIAMVFYVSFITAWHLVATAILVEWVNDEKTDEKDPQSPFTFRNKFSFRYCAVKLSTVLAGERELILHYMSRMRMDFLSHLAGGLQQETIPRRRSIPCAVFQMLILMSTKARHMLWSVMGLCAKRLK